MPVGVMLASMSATELATWRALAILEAQTRTLVHEEKVDPEIAEQMVWHVSDDDSDDDPE